MSAFKGTPGPWEVGETLRADELAVIGDGDSVVCEFTDRIGASVDADARLIAAAPELLKALEALFDRANHHTCTEIGGWFTDNDENVDALRKAEQAIAKATGGAA